MKKLEKYKTAPQVKFVKFKVKHFVEIPTINHDKAVSSPCLTAYNHLPPPLNASPPWLLGIATWFSSCPPPCLAMTQRSFPPLIPGGEDTMLQ